MTRPKLAHPPQSKISLPPLTVNDVEMSTVTSTFEDKVLLLMLRQTGSYLFLVTLAEFGRGSVDFLSSCSFFTFFYFCKSLPPFILARLRESEAIHCQHYPGLVPGLVRGQSDRIQLSP